MQMPSGKVFAFHENDAVFWIPEFGRGGKTTPAAKKVDTETSGQSPPHWKMAQDMLEDIVADDQQPAEEMDECKDIEEKLAKEVRPFLRQSQNLVYRNRDRFDKLYEKLHLDQEKVVVTLDEAVADAALEPATTKSDDPTAETIQRYATLQYLLNAPMFFQPSLSKDADGRPVMRFFCRDVEEVKLLQTQLDLVRNNRAPFRGFLRRMSGVLKMSADKERVMQVAKEDRDFLRTLIMFATMDRTFTADHHPLKIIAAAVMREFSYSPDRLTASARSFLMDIGVWKPWQHVDAVAEMFKNRDVWRSIRRKEVLMDKASAHIDAMLAKNADEQLASHDTTTHSNILDSAESAGRKDFGNLLSLCIDDFMVKEVDDAISFELDPSDLKSPWIHIHVADPSVFIRPECPVGELAMERVLTVYFPDKVIPMIPHNLAKTLSSISPNKSNYALTISVKLNDQGDIYDYQVRPSILRNVKHLAYENVDAFFRDQRMDSMLSQPAFLPNDPRYVQWKYSHRFLDGQEPPELLAKKSHATSVAPDAEGKFLPELLKRAELHYRHRTLHNGALNMTLPRAEIFLSQQEPYGFMPYEVPDQYRPVGTAPTVFVGIDMPDVSSARQMVAEWMIIAGRALGKFAQDRNIPLIFRSQEQSTFEPGEEESVRNLIVNGKIPAHACLQKLFNIPASVLTTDFGQRHSMLGVDTYAQATSPLRRISDLMAHWQVKAALADQPTPFRKEDLDGLIPEFKDRERNIKRMQNDSQRHWIRHFMRQDYQESMIEKKRPRRVMSAYVYDGSKDGRGYNVFIKDLAMRVAVRNTSLKRGQQTQIGEWITVAVASFDDHGNVMFEEV